VSRQCTKRPHWQGPSRRCRQDHGHKESDRVLHGVANRSSGLVAASLNRPSGNANSTAGRRDERSDRAKVYLDSDNVRPTTSRRQPEPLKAIEGWSAHGRAKRRSSGKMYHNPNSTTAAVIAIAAAPIVDSTARPAAT
jgi:hypothetical protein